MTSHPSMKHMFSLNRPHLKPDSPHYKYNKQKKKGNHIKAFKNPAEAIVAVSLSAKKKAHLPLPTLILVSVWSGLFIAIGGALAITAAGGIQLHTTYTLPNGTQTMTPTQIISPGFPHLVYSAMFPVNMMLILIMGGELFTGDTMTMFVGVLTRRITIPDLMLSYVVVWLSNYAGCVIGAVAFWGMGTVVTEDPWKAFLTEIAMGKVYTNFGINFLRAIPANFLVNCATIIALQAEDISGKIIGIWWCIFTFTACHFEHSIANMFFITLARLNGAPLNYGTFIWQNLIPVTLGNIIGGAIFVGFVMWYAYYKPILHQDIKNEADDIEAGRLA